MSYPGVDRLIHHFLVAAEAGSITGAAKTLNITQPALTRNIRLLEQHLKASLFERSSEGVALTIYGKHLARRAKLMQLEFHHALSELDALKSGGLGTVKIGVVSAWGLVYLPKAVAALSKKFKDIKIDLVSDLSHALVPRLLNGDLDLVCSGLSFPDHPDITKEPLIALTRVVIADSGHPLAKQDRPKPKQLLDYPWVVLRGDENAILRLGAYFSAFGLEPPRITVRCDSIDSLMSIVRTKEFLGTAPEPVTKHPVATGLSVIPIPGQLWHYQAGMAYRHTPSPPRSLQAILGCIRESFMSMHA